LSLQRRVSPGAPFRAGLLFGGVWGKYPTPVPGPLRRSLLGVIIVIGAMALGAVILWAVTEWLWLVVHQGLR
jgi:hypothetical protein